MRCAPAQVFKTRADGSFDVFVDGDEIYIAGFGESKVVVLPFAGSEA